jgi:hypothetical protein
MVREGRTATNYHLQPGDRLHVMAEYPRAAAGPERKEREDPQRLRELEKQIETLRREVEALQRTRTPPAILDVKPTTSGEVSAINKRKFEVPFLIDPANRLKVRELVMYYSTDEGRTWRRYSSVRPEMKGFTFHDAADGMYWLTVCTIDQEGEQHPADVARAPVGQKVLVDTQPPVVRLSAVREGKLVKMRWKAADDHLASEGITLEYRSAGSPTGDWKDVAIFTLKPEGELDFLTDVRGPMEVRLRAKDLAGNVAEAQVTAK